MLPDINILIVDDEHHCITVLKHELMELGVNATRIQSATDPYDAIEQIKEAKPQLIFLDIDMPLLSGFDLLNLCKDEKFDFIVTTAHQRYALTALKASAVDFLLKPVNSEELQKALDNFEKRRRHDLHYSIESLRAQLKLLQDQNHKTISIADTNGYRICAIADILALTASGEYTRISLSGDIELLASKNIGHYEDILPKSKFIRIHRKHIINKDYVEYLDRKDGGAVILTDKSKYPVARSKMKHLKMIFSPSLPVNNVKKPMDTG